MDRHLHELLILTRSKITSEKCIFIHTECFQLESQSEHEMNPNITDINVFFIVGEAGGYGSETKVMGGFGTNL